MVHLGTVTVITTFRPYFRWKPVFLTRCSVEEDIIPADGNIVA
jgi:hypothetical protein